MVSLDLMKSVCILSINMTSTEKLIKKNLNHDSHTKVWFPKNTKLYTNLLLIEINNVLNYIYIYIVNHCK